jgi:hypothetical protein
MPRSGKRRSRTYLLIISVTLLVLAVPIILAEFGLTAVGIGTVLTSLAVVFNAIGHIIRGLARSARDRTPKGS